MPKTGTSLAMGMIQVFCNKISFDDDVALWETSRTTTACWVFQSTTSFDLRVLLWDASSDVAMNTTFRQSCFSADTSQWDVSQVTSVFSMF